MRRRFRRAVTDRIFADGFRRLRRSQSIVDVRDSAPSRSQPAYVATPFGVRGFRRGSRPTNGTCPRIARATKLARPRPAESRMRVATVFLACSPICNGGRATVVAPDVDLIPGHVRRRRATRRQHRDLQGRRRPRRLRYRPPSRAHAEDHRFRDSGEAPGRRDRQQPLASRSRRRQCAAAQDVSECARLRERGDRGCDAWISSPTTTRSSKMRSSRRATMRRSRRHGAPSSH